MPAPVPLAEVTREPLVESVHWGHVAIADADGRLIAACGDPDRMVYMRSSSKPIQALAVVASGAADQFSFTPQELAICCASHHGRPEHVQAVLSILDKIGLGPDALQCGVHDPVDPEARAELCRRGERASPLHNNCSGKHAGMLATCRAMGWPIDDYIKPDHPLQRWHVRNIAAACGLREDQVVLGVDGCGVPTFGVPVGAVAVSFARLASGHGLPDDLSAAAARVREAIWAAPAMLSAPGTFYTALLEAGRSNLVAKGGAEGLLPVGAVNEAVAFAIRTEDGSARAIAPVTVALGSRFAWFPAQALSGYRELPVRNAHGWQVGVMRPAPALLEWLDGIA